MWELLIGTTVIWSAIFGVTAAQAVVYLMTRSEYARHRR
jgi:hypothetical protein